MLKDGFRCTVSTGLFSKCRRAQDTATMYTSRGVSVFDCSRFRHTCSTTGAWNGLKRYTTRGTGGIGKVVASARQDRTFLHWVFPHPKNRCKFLCAISCSSLVNSIPIISMKGYQDASINILPLPEP